MEEWYNDIKIEDVDEKYRGIVGVIGIENFIYLTKEIGGDDFYFPKTDCFLKNVKHRKIKEEYNGYNAKELSKKYGLTPKWIKQIVKDNSIDGQISLFQQESK